MKSALITGKRKQGKSNSPDLRLKEGRRGRRLRALERRLKDMRHWAEVSGNAKDQETWDLSRRKIQSAQRDIDGLRQVLNLD